jgi:hypothetical protein
MDIQTLNKIEELVINAHRVQEVKPASEPSHVYYLRMGDILERKEATPAVRAHKATALETVIAKAAETPHDEKVELWVSRDGITLLLNDDRRDTVRYALGLSDQIKTLDELARKNVSQKDLIFLLRTTFRDSLGLAGDLVAILRNVKFKVEEAGGSEIQHGKSSIGKSLSAEINGTKTLPEYVTLTVPVFAQAGVQQIRMPVECALEPDAATQTFRLAALPGAIERAVGDGERKLKVILEEGLAEAKTEHVPVFIGTP